MAKTRKSLPSAFGASIAIHAAFLVFLLFWAGLRPDEVNSKTPPIRTNLVFMQQSGEGGGGGGNPAPAPPTAMQIPAHRTPVIPITVAAPPVDPPPTFDATIQTNSATIFQGTGNIQIAPPGPGGGGRGTGLGPGDGPGAGPGSGGNSGGGPRRVGDGVTSPEPIIRAQPHYTNCAMQARISGTATVEAVVLANGTVGDVRIVGSLDARCGLDQEALKAARQWTFKPGMFEGKPADVIVRIILDFNLR